MSTVTERVTNHYECGGCGKEFEMETEPSDAGMTSTCPHCGRVDNECTGTDGPEAEPFTLRLIQAEAALGQALTYREATLEEGPPTGDGASWIAVRRLKRTKRPSWEEFDLSRSRLMKPSASVYVAPSGQVKLEGEIWFLEADRGRAELELRAAVRTALMRYEATVRETLLSEIGAFLGMERAKLYEGEARPGFPD